MITVWTALAKPCALEYVFSSRWSFLKLSCSALAPLAASIALEICCAEVSVGLGMLGVSGTIEGTSAVAGVCALVDSEPDWRSPCRPRGSEPEKAAFSDCWRLSYLEMFTDEIEYRTMNSANMSVSMSA